jgi:hypothetical protein
MGKLRPLVAPRHMRRLLDHYQQGGGICGYDEIQSATGERDDGIARIRTIRGIAARRSYPRHGDSSEAVVKQGGGDAKFN